MLLLSRSLIRLQWAAAKIQARHTRIRPVLNHQAGRPPQLPQIQARHTAKMQNVDGTGSMMDQAGLAGVGQLFA